MGILATRSAQNSRLLDLLIANGHPDTTVEKRIPDVRYYEPLLLFRRRGDKWENVSAQSGPIFSKSLAARGMAIGAKATAT